jgi:hypothetical protein
MRPDYQLIINDQDVSDRFKGRLIQLSLRDAPGFEADQLDITIDDSDDAVSLPEAGAVIRLKLGWQGEDLVDKGEYKVTEVEHSGAPDVIVIRALSADISAGLSAQKTYAWHHTTLGGIIATIAKVHGLKPAVSAVLESRPIQHQDQTDESDAHFLTRLGVEHDAVATVKNGYLLFIQRGESNTASGASLKPVTLTREDGDSHRYLAASRKLKYSGVRARWLDTDTAMARTVIIGEDGQCKVLRKTYSTEAAARSAANSEWRRISRSAATMSLTLAVGRLDLIPESPVVLEGWKKAITDDAWVVAEINHTLNDNGLVTSLSMEMVSP